jgi:hypothetical protein
VASPELVPDNEQFLEIIPQHRLTGGSQYAARGS